MSILPPEHKQIIRERLYELEFSKRIFALYQVYDDMPTQNRKDAEIAIIKALGYDFEQSLECYFDDYYMRIDILTLKYVNDENYKKEVDKRVEIIETAFQKQREFIKEFTTPVRGIMMGKDLGLLGNDWNGK
jgi:hypothetical protein